MWMVPGLKFFNKDGDMQTHDASFAHRKTRLEAIETHHKFRGISHFHNHTLGMVYPSGSNIFPTYT